MSDYRALAAFGAAVPPPLPHSSSLEADCVAFLRQNCRDLLFRKDREALTDRDGHDGVPYNFERDVDRLCLERAIHRFCQSASRENAFDVYVCYCEMFRPFGTGYQATRVLLETLSEHEGNSSSLLMKHRDHYAHSVYVFLLGLALYRSSTALRRAFGEKYPAEDDAGRAERFVRLWGLTALFHDIGYPFELAHQQIKTYVCQLWGIYPERINAVQYYAPFVSYKRMEDFTAIPPEKKLCVGHLLRGFGGEHEGLNGLLANALVRRLGEAYGFSYESALAQLTARPADSMPYMDHAYFSALIMARRLIAALESNQPLPDDTLDALCAILLHNSLFRFGLKGKSAPLSLDHGQPLAYLLMVCDELQCWDRVAYGQNSRTQVAPFGFDLEAEEGAVRLHYFFDCAGEDPRPSSAWRSMEEDGSPAGCPFLSAMAKFLDLSCLGKFSLEAAAQIKEKKTGTYLSDTKFLNLYDFALALNARYDAGLGADEMAAGGLSTLQASMALSFDQLSLEFKLSNIAQAKGFARHLEELGCFYTDRAVDYPVLTDFAAGELETLARLEHQRWQEEKEEMGWQYGTGYQDRRERALTRRHKDMVDFSRLTPEDIAKDAQPMRYMIRLLNLFEGLRIYRTGHAAE